MLCYASALALARDLDRESLSHSTRFSDVTMTRVLLPRDSFDSLSIPDEILGRVKSGRVTLTRAWREYLGFSQAEMAMRLGITPSEYAREEAKTARVPLARIAAALGISILQLCPAQEEEAS